MMKRIAALAALAVGVAAAPALAHTGHTLTSGFASGFAHPFGGLDHLAAMVTVGLWAAQYQGLRGLALPAGFVGGMIAGAAAAFLGAALPAVESGVALSIVLLGAALSFRALLPLGAATALTFVSGLAHGHAHGLEASGQALHYIAGFTLATALLHAIGGAMGLGLARIRLAAPVIGGLVALFGAALLAG